MPSKNRNIGKFTQTLQPSELIVDQRLQRTDVESLEPDGMIFRDCRYDWKKRSFRFATRRSRSYQHVTVASEDYRYRVVLNVAKFRPILLPDPSLNLGMQEAERFRVRA